MGNGSGAGIEVGKYRARAGALTLMYLTSGLDRDTLCRILAQAATDTELVGPDDMVEPEDDAGRIADVFADHYLVEPVDPDDDPDDPETVMQPTPAGREVPFVGLALRHWLQRCPAGRIELGEGSGNVLWPLLAGWTSTVIHALAAGPRTESEVRNAVGVLGEEAINARIALLEEAHMLRSFPARAAGEEARFEPTEWLRLAIVPLAAAARMELRHPCGDTAPIAAVDAEAALRLTLPLLRMKSSLFGACALQVELDEGVVGSPLSMTAAIEEGRVVACEPGIDPEADAWVAGPTAAWLNAVIDADQTSMRSGGDWRLPHGLLHELHRNLFRI